MDKSNSFKQEGMISIEKSSNFSDKVRLLTFQSREVLELLLRDGSYLADPTKSRERRDYKEDIAQLNGANPIWCFSPIGIRSVFTPMKVKDNFSYEDFISGVFFQNFRCEMSLGSGEGLNNLFLLEIECNRKLPKVGLTHNSYIGAVVIPKLELNNLIAVYQLNYVDDDDFKWYYPDVTIINIYKDTPLFKENFSCRKIISKKGIIKT